jgi:hypothetical protein
LYSRTISCEMGTAGLSFGVQRPNVDFKDIESYAATDSCIFMMWCIIRHWVSSTDMKL